MQRTLLDDPCVPVGVEGLRLVGRLEGGVSVKAESSVSPSLLYNRYNDSVALMDAARTGRQQATRGTSWRHHAPTEPMTRNQVARTSFYSSFGAI
jgi:hypothetical protein